MVKILLLEGSQTPDGNGAKMAAEFVKGVEEVVKEGEKVEVERVFLVKKKITPCNYCLACAKLPNHQCRIKDDVPELLEKILESDIIVNVIPIWFWGAPAFVKALLDRWTPWFKEGWGLREEIRERMMGSVMATIATCGAPNFDEMTHPATFMYDGLLGFMPKDVMANAGHVSTSVPVKDDKLAEAKALGSKAYSLIKH